ncbi:MAG: prolyl oligopeptidase family serine peptidase [Pirellulales bacterium]
MLLLQTCRLHLCTIGILVAVSGGCGVQTWTDKEVLAVSGKSFNKERRNLKTVIVREEPKAGPPDRPTDRRFELVSYQSPVGELAAYIAKPKEVMADSTRKVPAIIWITGGDCNSIGDVWSPMSRDNDQRAGAFLEAGMIMMYPSLRGGNMNPGKREGHFGEVDDVLAATDFLAAHPNVDSSKIYLGGHSTGGTLVMLVAEATDRYQAVFAFGPVSSIDEYGGDFVYCDPKNKEELMLRSPLFWLPEVTRPLFVIEGSTGNWQSIKRMVRLNGNARIQFIRVAGHDHFSILAPATEKLASGIVRGKLDFTAADFQNLK